MDHLVLLPSVPNSSIPSYYVWFNYSCQSDLNSFTSLLTTSNRDCFDLPPGVFLLNLFIRTILTILWAALQTGPALSRNAFFTKCYIILYCPIHLSVFYIICCVRFFYNIQKNFFKVVNHFC